MRILLVEDDLPLAEALTTLLLGAGYALDVTHDGLSAESLIGAERFDLVILDLNLPEKDGLSVLRSLRARKNPVPILILTARGEPAEKVAGLDLGADDYMVKPFDVGEFEARVRSILRRQAGLHASDVQIGPVRFDMARRPAAFLLAMKRSTCPPANWHCWNSSSSVRAGSSERRPSSSRSPRLTTRSPTTPSSNMSAACAAACTPMA